MFRAAAAAETGIDFDRLLWIRCAANIEHAFKATDLLLHAGGFGLVVLDMLTWREKMPAGLFHRGGIASGAQ